MKNSKNCYDKKEFNESFNESKNLEKIQKNKTTIFCVIRWTRKKIEFGRELPKYVGENEKTKIIKLSSV